jgi:hypothetical protein
MLMSQHATPEELQAAQAPTTFYVTVASILFAGFQDIVKGWKMDTAASNVRQQLADHATTPPFPPSPPLPAVEPEPQPHPSAQPTKWDGMSDFDIFHKLDAEAKQGGKTLLSIDTIRDESGKVTTITPHYLGEVKATTTG